MKTNFKWLTHFTLCKKHCDKKNVNVRDHVMQQGKLEPVLTKTVILMLDWIDKQDICPIS